MNKCLFIQGIDFNGIYDAYSTILETNNNNDERSRERSRINERTVRLSLPESAIVQRHSNGKLDY